MYITHKLMMDKQVFTILVLISASFVFTYADQSVDEKAVTTCGEMGDCLTVDTDCKQKCGCDKTIPTFYDNKTDDCVINIKLLILSLNEKYNTEGKIRAEADKIFQGIIVAALLFISCASICVFTACIYCCRINYADYRLKKSIKELAKKVGAKPRLDKPTVKPATKPISESCNVVVEEAGVFCV